MCIIQEQGAMVRPCILVVVVVESFALCKDDLCPFCNYYVVFKVTIQFSISYFILGSSSLTEV
jgi:hypothetical protein